MLLTIVRHGETFENASGTVQGHSYGSLSEKGKDQAKKLSERLSSERFDVAYVSDLKRTRQTAEAIMKHHDVPVEFVPIIRERKMGEFEGRPKTDYYAARDASGLPKKDFRPDGGENYNDVRKLARSFLSELDDRHTKESILVVSHGMFNRTLIAEILDISIDESLKIPQENTTVNIIEVSKQQSKAIMINDHSHLNGS